MSYVGAIIVSAILPILILLLVTFVYVKASRLVRAEAENGAWKTTHIDIDSSNNAVTERDNDDDDKDLDEEEDIYIDEDNVEEERSPFSGRRLPSYHREGIVIPDWSIDSRLCDDFKPIDPITGLSPRPLECLVSDGYVSCFECVESRASLHTCVHLNEPLTIYVDSDDSIVRLPANTSPLYGYCLRENIARDIRKQRHFDHELSKTRRRCSITNADWILVRTRASFLRDSSYNFVCRCKYPHLLTNVAGPQTACARDVACNGHGHLDDLSSRGVIDPFISGECECEDGWIAERDDLRGPYCREARFSEWPSALYGVKLSSDDLNLDSDAVSAVFRRSLARSRLDGDKPVWLPNPCSPCPLLASPDAKTYFCGDDVSLAENKVFNNAEIYSFEISRLNLGVKRERDYLQGNGGRFPNACLSVNVETDIDSQRVMLQYMSQSWNDGDLFAQEVGFLVRRDAFDRFVDNGAFATMTSYSNFRNSLVQPENHTALQDYGIVWTATAYEMRQHRAQFCRILSRLFEYIFITDLCYLSPTHDAWFEFPFYTSNILYYYYYVLPRKHVWKFQRNEVRISYCPDERALHYIAEDNIFDVSRSIELNEALAIANSMVPVCMTRLPHEVIESSCRYRPEINHRHENVTGCVLFDGLYVQYSRMIWHPRGMDMRHHLDLRAKRSFVQKPCPNDTHRNMNL